MEKIANTIYSLRSKKPLILNLTNVVTMDFVANCLLAIGAAPIMSTCEGELDELVALSSAVYINIGTLNSGFIDLTKKAIYCSVKYKKPIILDPVGAGATTIRTKISHEIAYASKIIRGNASEIIALSNSGPCLTKGVESIHGTEDAESVANKIATDTKATVVVSGATDYITDGISHKKVPFGSPIMGKITGMGCALTAVIATMYATGVDSFEASVIGTQYFALCGQLATLNCTGPGSFRAAFIDGLHGAKFDLMETLLKESKDTTQQQCSG